MLLQKLKVVLVRAQLNCNNHFKQAQLPVITSQSILDLTGAFSLFRYTQTWNYPPSPMEMNENTDKRTVFQLTASRAGYWNFQWSTENSQEFRKPWDLFFWEEEIQKIFRWYPENNMESMIMEEEEKQIGKTAKKL